MSDFKVQSQPRAQQTREDIAIVGMSVNVPGAQSVQAFWANLRAGVESIRQLDEAELIANGEAAEKLRRKNYVPAAAMLEGYADFDAEFFGFSPKDAAILDPQHRKFLEVAWEAMEQAGHLPESVAGPIGVYAGCGMGSYFYFNICSNPELVDDVGMFLLRHTGNDKDFLSTRVSHVFDLRGPSINLQTACSTSLVAIHYAAQALQAGEVDMALAGGVTIELPQGRGYEFKENEILSPDGHCHAFDHRAQGTVFGSGAGCVALRRLSDAIADGDHIWGVIKGSAVNNDGAAKAGYLAPSVDGQSAAIRAALDAAGVAAQSIGYVECHGTGTYLGDPIEVAALTQAHRASTQASDYCRIGSVKTNIGHLDTAAGVAGLVKAALALHHREIPPSLGYDAPNPAIDFDGSPFSVADKLTPWASDVPRRAAVNALGVGGTNAHMIIEQAPARAASEASDWPFQPLVISARSTAALEAASANLAAHFRANPEVDLADVAWTLKEGRRGFDKRRVLVAQSPIEAAEILEQGDSRKLFTHSAMQSPDVVFMFPGGGAQYPDMARDLYETEPVFADWMDRGLDHLQGQLDYDIRAIWLPEGDAEAAAEQLKQPSVQLPLIAITEYALAQLWMSWGVVPAQMVGHSMGENVAACLAGVMTFENLIDLVLLRGRLFDTVPAGGMLSISLPLDQVEPLLGDALDVASVNAPNLTAVSGPQAALEALQEVLRAREVEFQRIAIDIAAHSRMLEPILAQYRGFLAGLDLQAPQKPFLSNRSGEFITDAQATSPDYWVEQLRRTVNFADCIARLAAQGDKVYLEVGPGKALSSLAQMCPSVKPGQVLSSLRHPEQEMGDDAYFMGVLARLWACGVAGDWAQIWGAAKRQRVVLPTYPFQRATYFIEPGAAAVQAAPAVLRADEMRDWGWVRRWKPAYANCETDLAGAPQRWLIFVDAGGLGDAAAAQLRGAGHQVSCVLAGDAFAQIGADRFTLAPEQGRAGYDALLAALAEAGAMPERIAHFWQVTQGEDYRPGSSFFDRNLEQGFWSLMWLGQALAEAAPEAVHLTVFTNGGAQVQGEALAYPEKAMIAGPLGALAREVPGVTCATVDLEIAAQPEAKRGWFAKRGGAQAGPDAALALEDMIAAPANSVAAHRAGRRFEMSYVRRELSQPAVPAFKQGGKYLITGGFGGIGLTIAADLLGQYGAHVLLLSRSALPPRAQWDAYLQEHAAAEPAARRIRAAQRLEALGGRLDVVQGDVLNPAEMAAVIEGAGALTGVIHAAGALDDAPLLGKSDAQAQAVLAPKVQGLRVLDDLLPDGAIDMLVLFSSTSTATRGAGQADYVAANEYLNAYAAARSGDATQVVAVNWGVWADVGMAAAALGGAADVMPMREIEAAILARSGSDAAGAPMFEADLRAQDWLLDQHRTGQGQAVMPGTGMVEILAEAAAAQGLGARFVLSDLYFLRALDVAEGAARRARVVLRAEAGGFAAELRSDLRMQGREGWQLHAQAQLAPLEGAAPAPLDLAAIAARCGAPEQAASGARLVSPQEAHLKFGPEWHVLRQMAWGEAEGIAHLSLDADCAAGAGTVLHPGLLDLATGWAIGHVPGYGAKSLWVPVSYGRIAVYGSLPRAVVSHVRLVSHGEGAARFDVVICAPDGAVLVQISDFSMTRLADGFATSAPDAREVLFEDAQEARALSPAEERLADLVHQGITAAEGPQALARAVSAGAAQIYVTALPLDGLMAQADMPAVQPGQSAQFARPDTGAEVTAPRNAVEAKLAEIWSNLLGISPVGVEDSFFDLGGHSLIAVRLFAGIKRAWGVDFPISVLFEAPTIEKLAAMIAQQSGVAAGALEGAPEVPAEAGPRFTHLVPLNQHSGDAPPLFVVAGMFGNVLNLRHLAMQFADERRVYGLQARGLIGEDAPHETVQSAAADYIAELRQVQPEGPYLLSGFSGGGITAYEMAQQLRAMGQEVAVLALLDTPLPVRPSLSKPDKALIKLAELRRKGPGFLVDWAKARWDWERRGKYLQGAAQNGPAAFNNRKIEQAFLQAVGQYETQVWEGPLTLLRPKLDLHWKVTGGRYVSAEREYVLADNDWTRYAPQIEVIEVPGDHDSMVLLPNVVVMAGHLRRVIAQARGADAPAQLATAAE
ncbi:MAG: type I polyketide synthase [Sulfitobacter sp.]